MFRKFNITSAVGLLITLAGFAIDAIQGALAEKRQEELIKECVKEEVKAYLEEGKEPPETIVVEEES